jgi:predicted Co/Zn/Cd cation transporter (cation efflux family)
VRATKLGRKLYVEVDFVVQPGHWDVSDEDDVRRGVLAALAPLGFDVWANVELTTDPSLVD